MMHPNIILCFMVASATDITNREAPYHELLAHPTIGKIKDSDWDQYRGYKPIDAVYTWVNGSDPEWQKSKEFWYHDYYTQIHGGEFNKKGYIHQKKNFVNIVDSRFRDHDELRYSLRSLELYAPWIRHVYIVTANQVPSWLAVECPFVTVVPHSAIFATASHLPTFNSAAIEANLDRIPGLSETFVYLNDDFFLGRPIFPSDFISRLGVQKVYESQCPSRPCAKSCPSFLLGNGICDKACNVTACGYDLGDCGCRDSTYETRFGISKLCTRNGTDYCDNLNCDCALVGNGKCDSQCNNNACGFDGGDCSPVKPRIQDVAAINAKDTYADAVNHVNMLLNKAFGAPIESRKKIAHAPYVIQRSIIQEMREKWPEEFHRTSSHRFRHPHDLQYAFVYMNYIMNRQRLSPEELFDKFIDVNQNGRVDETEMALTITKLKQGRRKKNNRFFIEDDAGTNAREEAMLRQCLSHDNRMAILSEMAESSCAGIIQVLATVFMFEVVPTKDLVLFAMLSEKNYKWTLKSAYNSTSLFLCFNDNIKNMKKEINEMLSALFETRWPTPSQFELSINNMTQMKYHAHIMRNEFEVNMTHEGKNKVRAAEFHPDAEMSTYDELATYLRFQNWCLLALMSKFGFWPMLQVMKTMVLSAMRGKSIRRSRDSVLP